MLLMMMLLMMLESYRSVEKRREREEEKGKERPDGAIMYAEAACGRSCMAWRMCMDIHVFCMGRSVEGGRVRVSTTLCAPAVEGGGKALSGALTRNNKGWLL